MRHVTGRTDSVVIVGAGLGGLSAALRLAGAGRSVTVVERLAEPGGRAGSLRRDGYTFDTGPTVLTMPELLDDALACVGERLADRVELVRLDPVYRGHYPDGSTLDLRPGVDATADEIAKVCGPREAAGYRALASYVTEMYRLEMRHFIDRNLDSPLDLVRPELARMAAMGGFRRLAPVVGRYLRDPRTRRLLSFQSMYAGLSPYDALAIYSVIAYMDVVAGVWFPRGGIAAVPRALATAAADAGVVFRYRTEVARVETRSGRASAVLTTDGERIPADVVVLNADLPVAYRELLPERHRPRRLDRLRYSPSCFLLLAGSSAAYSRIAHHNIHFGAAWREVFDDIIGTRRAAPRLMRDPSLLVTNPTRTDRSLAPPGREAYYVLFPTPNSSAPLDWATLGPRYRDEVVATLERRGYVGFGDAIEVEDVTTPLDWERRGMASGAPFAVAHTFRQTGPFRPGNLAPGLDNVVLTGSSTQPGVGVPMVLVSGRLAAERILGPDPAYRSRAWV